MQGQVVIGSPVIIYIGSLSLLINFYRFVIYSFIELSRRGWNSYLASLVWKSAGLR